MSDNEEYDYRVVGDWMAYPDLETLYEDYPRNRIGVVIERRRKAGEWELS